MHTMDGLDVAPDLINELGELLQVHCGTILCVLHILNALHQRILQLSLNLVGGCFYLPIKAALSMRDRMARLLGALSAQQVLPQPSGSMRRWATSRAYSETAGAVSLLSCDAACSGRWCGAGVDR